MQYITSYLFQLKYTLLNFKWQGDLRKRKNFQPKEEKKKNKSEFQFGAQTFTVSSEFTPSSLLGHPTSKL